VRVQVLLLLDLAGELFPKIVLPALFWPPMLDEQVELIATATDTLKCDPSIWLKESSRAAKRPKYLSRIWSEEKSHRLGSGREENSKLNNYRVHIDDAAGTLL
jgi:hypothetical protein